MSCSELLSSQTRSPMQWWI